MENKNISTASKLSTFATFIKLAGTTLGLICIIMGFLYIRDIYKIVHQGITNPEIYNETIDKWANILGGPEALVIRYNDQKITYDKAIAMVVICMGLFVLTWIVLGLMATGAKIIYWTTTQTDKSKEALAI
ncbi:hypothetical protein KAJ27_04645 [bacterium]|nr:hypothetical protein [bacterium]